METEEIPSMQFPDGEKFDLIDPEITIPQSAFNTDPVPSNYAVRLESTIGIGGTGLIDAIPSEDIVGQPGTLSRYLAVLKYMTKKSHAYSAAMNFYKAPKSERDAVVKFLRSI